MERKQIGLSARQTKINGKICATGEIGNKRAAVRGSAESCSLEKNIWKIALCELGGWEPIWKTGILCYGRDDLIQDLFWCTELCRVWKSRAIICNIWNETVGTRCVQKRSVSIQESLTELSLSHWCWTSHISSEFSITSGTELGRARPRAKRLYLLRTRFLF